MKIYIKDYLKNIPLIDKFCKLLIGYSLEYPEDSIDSFDEYYKSKLTDNVMLFLDYVLPDPERLKEIFYNSSLEELIKFRKNQLTYLYNLFYSVKGTYKVLDYLTEYDLFQTGLLSNTIPSIIDFSNYSDKTSKITYTTKGITIEIKNLPNYLDRDIFCNYLENFLSNLLYFEELTIKINEISFNISEVTKTFLNKKEYYFNYYEATNEKPGPTEQ